MNWERARKPEQIAERREAILNAARSMFSELDYEDISLNGIAREANFSKPNVYRYFATREEIFLVIFAAEQEKFVSALINRLKRIRTKDTVEAISVAWVDVALKNRIWLDLLPQLSNSLEKNSSVEQLIEFKKNAKKGFDDVIDILVSIHNELSPDQWAAVVRCTFSLMAGLWPIGNPGENVVEAMHQTGMSPDDWKFEQVMKSGLAALIRGMR